MNRALKPSSPQYLPKALPTLDRPVNVTDIVSYNFKDVLAISSKVVFWVYWISTGLLCLGYLSGAAFYAFQHDMVAGMFGQLGYPAYLTYLLPVVIGAGPCRNPVAVFCAA